MGQDLATGAQRNTQQLGVTTFRQQHDIACKSHGGQVRGGGVHPRTLLLKVNLGV